MRQITARVCGNPARPLTLASCSSRQSAEPVVLSLTHPSRQPPSPHTPSQPQPSPSHAPFSAVHERKTRRTTQAGNFSTRGEGSVGNFSGVLEVISGRSHLNWAGNLDSPSPPPSSPLELALQASAITESPSWTSVFVAFANQERLCHFDAACAQISPLACTLDTLGVITVCVFPGWHISLTTSRS